MELGELSITVLATGFDLSIADVIQASTAKNLASSAAIPSKPRQMARAPAKEKPKKKRSFLGRLVRGS